MNLKTMMFIVQNSRYKNGCLSPQIILLVISQKEKYMKLNLHIQAMLLTLVLIVLLVIPAFAVSILIKPSPPKIQKLVLAADNN